jgi:hypothetical protein
MPSVNGRGKGKSCREKITQGNGGALILESEILVPDWYFL